MITLSRDFLRRPRTFSTDSVDDLINELDELELDEQRKKRCVVSDHANSIHSSDVPGHTTWILTCVPLYVSGIILVSSIDVLI